MSVQRWYVGVTLLPLMQFLTTQAVAEDTIIVEGTRMPVPSTETGSTVYVITDQEIEARGYSFLLDAVATVSGVTVNQNGPFGGLTTVRIRGAGSGQTLVLLDGIPVGDPAGIDGAYDFSIFDTIDVERVEVLSGAQSTLWGSDAIGGVINIISKKPEPGLSGRIFVEGGSFNTVRGGGFFDSAGEKGGLSIGVSGIATDGISKADEDDGNTENDGYEGQTISARGDWRLSTNARIEGALRHMIGKTDIDGFSFSASGFSFGDTDDTTETRQTTGSLSLLIDSLDGKLNHQVSTGFTDIERDGNFGGFLQKDNGERVLLRYQGTLSINDQNRLAAGIEREENDARNNGTDLGSTDINALFALYEVKPFTGLTLTAGLRQDDHSDFGSKTTTRVAGAIAVNDRMIVRGSWGQGFKAPTIFQLTQSFGPLPPNADLRPETSEAFDLGFDYSTDQFSTRLTYFSRDTENEIIFDPDFRYSNLDSTTAEGLEFSGTVQLTSNIIATGNYAFIDAEDRTSGERQIRIPRHSGDASLAYHSAGPVSGNISLRYNGKETEGAFGNDVAAWTRVDVAASYAVNNGVEIYGRIENLFDEEYQQVSGFGTPGLSGYTGIRVKL